MSYRLGPSDRTRANTYLRVQDGRFAANYKMLFDREFKVPVRIVAVGEIVEFGDVYYLDSSSVQGTVSSIGEAVGLNWHVILRFQAFAHLETRPFEESFE